MRTPRLLHSRINCRTPLILYEGKIKVELLPNGQYHYDDNSVYQFLNKDLKRRNVVYARVSTAKQKQDLENQVDTIISYMNKNGFGVDKVYKEIKSGMHFDRREFQKLLNSVMNNEVERVFITYRDRFARLSFDLMVKLFSNFGTEIVVINKIESNEEKELYEDLMSVIHSFSMKQYSDRRKKLKEEVKRVTES
ncbi:MAG TPA: IS607 family transposase [Campylobacterales bacterium]|nr:IS607 family transposase [Campylobacterales bacterium]